MTRRAGMAYAAGYLLTIAGANWAIGQFGIIPVGFGYQAPAGVWFVAAALILRDAVQYGLGRLAALAAMAAGIVLSVAVASPGIALASGLAFGTSELIDFALFTWIAPRWARAVLAAGLAGAVADSAVFLALTYGVAYLPGQVLGKSYGILAAAAVIAWRQRRRALPC